MAFMGEACRTMLCCFRDLFPVFLFFFELPNVRLGDILFIMLSMLAVEAALVKAAPALEAALL